MTDKLNAALNNIETTYQELVEIANSMLSSLFSPINQLVGTISQNINSLTTSQVRDYILDLQLKAFELSETKEKAAMKAELAEALQKERFATCFNGMDGSATVKEKLALVETSSEIVAEVLYNLISNLLKTKLDQVHRLIDSLKSVLMSRMQETKFMNIGSSSEPTGTYSMDGKTVINNKF